LITTPARADHLDAMRSGQLQVALVELTTAQLAALARFQLSAGNILRIKGLT